MPMFPPLVLRGADGLGLIVLPVMTNADLANLAAVFFGDLPFSAFDTKKLSEIPGLGFPIFLPCNTQ
jgi:prolyl-tRNA editing enzyme YbaK/EbsC (Cys-tRNA(Pro) deacylase)